MPCAHRFKCHGDPLHLPILHPHCPMRELSRQQVWLGDVLALRVQHLQKGGDAVTWRERKIKGWRTGKGSTLEQGENPTHKTTPKPKPNTHTRDAGPICQQLLPLAKALEVSAPECSAAASLRRHSVPSALDRTPPLLFVPSCQEAVQTAGTEKLSAWPGRDLLQA